MSKAVEGEIADLVTTQTALGRALGLSQQRIGQLIDEGIVIRDETARNGQVMFFESVRNFFLSRKKNWGEESTNVNFWEEKGLHEKAKRELSEIKLRKMRGEVYDASKVEGVLSEILTNFRNRLLGLPAKYAAQLDGKRHDEIFSILTTAIEENLNELTDRLSNVNFTDDSDIDAENLTDN